MTSARKLKTPAGEGKGFPNIKTRTGKSSSDALTLVTNRSESRVDSRLIAQALGNQHKNALSLIERYRDALSGLGKVAFQTEPLPSGQRERFAGRAGTGAAAPERTCAG